MQSAEIEKRNTGRRIDKDVDIAAIDVTPFGHRSEDTRIGDPKAIRERDDRKSVIFQSSGRRHPLAIGNRRCPGKFALNLHHDLSEMGIRFLMAERIAKACQRKRLVEHGL